MNEIVHILAVDDEEFNLDLIALVFEDVSNIRLSLAKNGKEALNILDTEESIDVILLDLRMPIMDGFEFLEYIKESNYKNIPVLVVTANQENKNRALRMGANDFLAKPFDVEELKLRTINYAKLKKSQDELKFLNINLDNEVKKKTKELQESLEKLKDSEYEISFRVGKTAEFRDLETGMHIKRMSYMSAKMAQLLGLSDDEVDLVLKASPLHDIGKVGIPDKILLKNGRLDKDEFKIMKLHSVIGGKILKDTQNYPILSAGRTIALQHHEKWDGSGYPKGLKGEDIHLYARVVAIADVFDALTSKRVYKEAYSLEKSLNIMREGRGSHFDPKLLDIFLDNIEEFVEIKDQFIDKEFKGNLIQQVARGKL
jgi:putative two-component system response regulator